MVDIQSKEVIDKMSTELKVQPSLDLPRELGKQILPVFNVNPDRLIKSKLGSASDATTATIMTTSTVKDTFLTGINLSIAKDVVSDSLHTEIVYAPFGEPVGSQFRIRYEPLTAGQFTQSIMFSMPIKLARGSVVRVDNTTATASIDSTATIFFYEVDPL